MERDEIFYALKSLPIFKNMQHKDLMIISSSFEKVNYQKRDVIDYAQTDKYFFVVTAGKIKMTKMDIKSGKTLALFLNCKGDVFDILPLLDGREHDVEFVVVESADVLKIDIELMRQYIRRYNELNGAFFLYLASKIKELEEFSENIAFYDTKTRLAKLILRGINNRYLKEEEPIPVELVGDLTHESMAELIGSVRSIVTTEIGNLKKEGILIAEKGKMAIKDLEKLLEACTILKKD